MDCTDCGSSHTFKDGLRDTNEGKVQRYLCCDCGSRFSDNSHKECQTNMRSSQLGVLKKAKKLDSATETKPVAGDLKTLQKSKGRFVKFLSSLENDGTCESSAKLYAAYLKRIEGSGGNLLDSESVKATIAKKKWSSATKALAVAAYSKYLSIVGGTWKPPKYQAVRKLPYVPTEKEIDCLINAAYRKHSTFLLLLKETGMRSSEAWN